MKIEADLRTNKSLRVTSPTDPSQINIYRFSDEVYTDEQGTPYFNVIVYSQSGRNPCFPIRQSEDGLTQLLGEWTEGLPTRYSMVVVPVKGRDALTRVANTLEGDVRTAGNAASYIKAIRQAITPVG